MRGSARTPAAEEDAESDLYRLVKELTELPGPVGHEDAVQDRLVERWGRTAVGIRRSRVGNVLARVGGGGPRLVLVAHADEICLMVKSVSEDGFLYLWPYYGDTRGDPPRSFAPAGQPALVVTDDGLVDGVIASASGHVVGGRHSQENHLEWNDLFVDVGASSRGEAQTLGIAPGNRVI